MWVYFWDHHSVTLIYVPVFVPVLYNFGCCSFVVYFEIREHNASSYNFSLLRLLWLLGFLEFHTILWLLVLVLWKNVIYVLIGTTLNLQITLDSYEHFNDINSSNRKWNIFPVICVFFSFFRQCHGFQGIGLLHSLLNVFLGILLFLMQCEWDYSLNFYFKYFVIRL